MRSSLDEKYTVIFYWSLLFEKHTQTNSISAILLFDTTFFSDFFYKRVYQLKLNTLISSHSTEYVIAAGEPSLDLYVSKV